MASTVLIAELLKESAWTTSTGHRLAGVLPNAVAAALERLARRVTATA